MQILKKNLRQKYYTNLSEMFMFWGEKEFRKENKNRTFIKKKVRFMPIIFNVVSTIIAPGILHRREYEPSDQ